VLDLLPLLAELADPASSSPRSLAGASATFHARLATSLADWVAWASRRTGLLTVACGGGCLQNEVLARTLHAGLAARGVRMLEAALVPPNDGAISLGQCWVAQRSRRE
jgi:hydrogenase maturation protein HypF